MEGANDFCKTSKKSDEMTQECAKGIYAIIQ